MRKYYKIRQRYRWEDDADEVLARDECAARAFLALRSPLSDIEIALARYQGWSDLLASVAGRGRVLHEAIPARDLIYAREMARLETNFQRDLREARNWPERMETVVETKRKPVVVDKRWKWKRKPWRRARFSKETVGQLHWGRL